MAQSFGIDPEDLRVRDGEYPLKEHPLETAWTFWYDKKTSDKKESDQYMEGLRQLGSFNTVEGFYRHYTHLLRPSELPRDHNCYMFRKNYKPMWEEFPEGGCWIIRIKRKASLNYVNHMWENLLLACIGEAFEMPDVVGCVLSTRLKDDVLSIWNLSNRGTPARFRIGERLKEVLDLNMTALIQYKDHMQSLQDYSTYRNARSYMFAPSPNTTPMQHAMSTPLHAPHGHETLHDDLEGNLLPPAFLDAMLPPAALDSEGFGGPAGSSSGAGRRASPLLGPSRSPPVAHLKSPPMSAQAAPFTPSSTTAAAAAAAGGRSPPMSAQAAPFTPSSTTAAAAAAGGGRSPPIAAAAPPRSSPKVAVPTHGPSNSAAAAAAAAVGGAGSPDAPPASGGEQAPEPLSWAAKAAASARKEPPPKAAPKGGAMPTPPSAAPKRSPPKA